MQQDLFHLACADFRVEDCQRNLTAQRPIGPGKPGPCLVQIAEGLGSEPGNAGDAVNAIGFGRRQVAFSFPP